MATKLILMRGGPQEWDGKHALIHRTEGDQLEIEEDTLERWDHAQGRAAVYRRTDETAAVPFESETRAGPTTDVRTAEVYEFSHHKGPPIYAMGGLDGDD